MASRLHTVVKVKYNGSLRRFNFDETKDCSFALFSKKIRNIFTIPVEVAIVVTYIDDDDDQITMACDDDLVDAISVQSLNPLRVTVSHASLVPPADKDGEESLDGLSNSASISKSSSVAESASSQLTSSAAKAMADSDDAFVVVPPVTVESVYVAPEIAPEPAPEEFSVKAPVEAEGAEPSSVVPASVEATSSAPRALEVPQVENAEDKKPEPVVVSVEEKEDTQKEAASPEPMECFSGVPVSVAAPVSVSAPVSVAEENFPVPAETEAENSSKAEATKTEPEAATADKETNGASAEGTTTGSARPDAESVFLQMRQAFEEHIKEVLKESGLPEEEMLKGFKDVLETAPAKIADVLELCRKSGLAATFEPVFERSDGTTTRSQEKNGADAATGNTDAGSGKSEDTGRTAAEFPEPEKVYHPGVQCDICGMCPIVGMRFKSLVKHDYDLCQTCFASKGREIDYTRIERPVVHRGRYGFGGPHHRMHGMRHGCNSGGGVPPFGRPFPHHPSRGSFRGSCDRAAASAVEQQSQQGNAPSGANGFPCGNSIRMDARFVKDVTIFDGTELEPEMLFTKIWRLRNIGTVPWPRSTQLVFVGGDRLSEFDVAPIQVPEKGIAPGEEMEVAVDLVSPSKPGRYVSHWRLQAAWGPKFGHRVWALIQVVSKEDSGSPDATTAAVQEQPASTAAPESDVPAASGSAAAAPAATAVSEGTAGIKVPVALSEDEPATSAPVPAPLSTPADVSAHGSVIASAPAPSDSGIFVAYPDIQSETSFLVAQAPSPATLIGEDAKASPRAEVTTDGEYSVVHMPTLATSATTAPSASPPPTVPTTAPAPPVSTDKGKGKEVEEDTVIVEEMYAAAVTSEGSSGASSSGSSSSDVGPSGSKATSDEVSPAVQEQQVQGSMEVEQAPVQENGRIIHNVQYVSPEEARFQAGMLDQLQAMGFNNGTLNRKLLEKHSWAMDATVDELVVVNDWEPMLEELKEMGFEDEEVNKQMMAKHNGSVKRAVKELVQLATKK